MNARDRYLGYWPHLPSPREFIVECSATYNLRSVRTDREKVEFVGMVKTEMRTGLATKLVNAHFEERQLNDWESEFSMRFLVLQPTQFYQLCEAEIDRRMDRERRNNLEVMPRLPQPSQDTLERGCAALHDSTNQRFRHQVQPPAAAMQAALVAMFGEFGE
jgi:hypothetical protein